MITNMTPLRVDVPKSLLRPILEFLADDLERTIAQEPDGDPTAEEQLAGIRSWLEELDDRSSSMAPIGLYPLFRSPSAVLTSLILGTRPSLPS